MGGRIGQGLGTVVSAGQGMLSATQSMVGIRRRRCGSKHFCQSMILLIASQCTALSEAFMRL